MEVGEEREGGLQFQRSSGADASEVGLDFVAAEAEGGR